MRVFITGGLGFIGSNLAKYFLEKENEIVIFDNMSRKNVEKNLQWLKESDKKNLTFINGDIRDFDALKKYVKDADVIFHTAAQTAVTTSLKSPREDFDINALGTFNVLEAARLNNNDTKVIFTSTNKVYGDNVNAIPLREKETRYEFFDTKFNNGIPETFPTDANEHTPYGCSKYVGDLYVRDYYKIFGLKTVVFRMSCIYGTHQYGNEDQGWVAHFVISSIFNKPLTIFGDGKQVRDILFIGDLVRAFELALKNISKTKGSAYNIGGGPKNTISLLELLDMLKKFGLTPKYSFDDWRPADQKVYISDISKAKKFGWRPKISVQNGIKKLVDWVKENKHLFN